jgi:diaminohydroxyphosphoribosylaminopyrimidine deaminase/5-amino-6-(5-phosphoribosylamino)uracil reductase
VVSTLEPCAHTGRTGPCTAALIDARIAHLVYAVSDPTADAGGGGGVLQATGIDVRPGRYAEEAAAGALRAWLFAVDTGRPLVTWKFAATLDGRVAAADGSSRWITGEQARIDVHRLRVESDAILIGSGTALADDPQLTARRTDGDLADHQPLRVVLDRRGRTLSTARLYDDAAPTLVLDSADPVLALKVLYDRGIRSVLLEGGPTLAGAFAQAGLVDRVVSYLAPALLGDGPAALGPAGMSTIGEALRLRVEDVTRVGEDVRITAIPRKD